MDEDELGSILWASHLESYILLPCPSLVLILPEDMEMTNNSRELMTKFDVAPFCGHHLKKSDLTQFQGNQTYTADSVLVGHRPQRSDNARCYQLMPPCAYLPKAEAVVIGARSLWVGTVA